MEDIREDCVEENDRRTCSHGRNEDIAGEEANLKIKLDDDVNGASTRCVAMIDDCRGMCRKSGSLYVKVVLRNIERVRSWHLRCSYYVSNSDANLDNELCCINIVRLNSAHFQPIKSLQFISSTMIYEIYAAFKSS